MQISWINKFSLIEFPWEIACVIFTPYCNFRCDFCHNPEFVLPERLKEVLENLISEEAFFNFLETRKNTLTWVSICWWEPTLQKDLKEFCKKLKDLWFKVKLDTNGRDSKIIQELLDENLLDYVAMDFKHEPWKWSEIVGMKIDEEEYLKTAKLIMNSGIDYEFRTTIIKWVHDEKSIENMAKYISWAKNYYLQNYRAEKTLNPNFEWESFSSKELEDFKKICERYVESVGVRS